MAINQALDDEDDLDTDADTGSDDSDAGDAVAADDAPLPPPPAEGDDPKPVPPLLKAYLENQSSLKDAQGQAQKNSQATGISAALVQLGHGLSRADGKADLSGVQALAANDDAPVKNFLADQASGDRAVAAQKELESSDPDSQASQAARANLKASFPKIADAYGKSFDNLTADDMPNILKVADTKAAIDERAQASRDRADTSRINAQARADAASAGKDAKNAQLQDKASQDFYKNDQSFRGNKAVQNANEALRNSDQAMEIINSSPDYNKLSPTQYNLLTSEVAKIASGGAATEASAHDVRAQTLASQAANFWQSVSGQPTGAQLGAFVQQNKDYLDGLNQVNHKYVDSYRADNFRGHAHQLSDDVKQEYLDNNPGVAAILKGGKGGPSAPTGQMPGQAPAAPVAHPQDSQAVQWAKANPTDPRAAKILQLNGAQ